MTTSPERLGTVQPWLAYLLVVRYSTGIVARLEPLTCPKCGAQVTVDAASSFVECAYCHVTSFLQRSAGSAPPTDMPVIVLPAKSPAAGVALLVTGALLVGGGALGAALLFRTSPAPDLPPATALPSPAARTSEKQQSKVVAPPSSDPPAKPSAIYRVERRPLVGDANGDNNDDLVVFATKDEGSESIHHYVVLDGKSGRHLAQTPAFAPGFSVSAALAPGRLVVETKQGQLSAYDLKSGDLQWTTVLGDRVLHFCGSSDEESIQVVSADGRTTALDTKTGRQATVSGTAPCRALRSDNEVSFTDPRDRSDGRAPQGIESIRCGSVRVMGSENYVVPDLCRIRAHINSDALDGVSSHVLWKYGGGYLVFGSRTPGTRIPMLGSLIRGKFLWKSDVPETNPLEVEEGAPQHVALAGKVVVVTYTVSATRQSFLTAFAVDDGKRLWTAACTKNHAVEDLTATADRVWVRTSGALFGYSLADGSLQATFGTPR